MLFIQHLEQTCRAHYLWSFRPRIYHTKIVCQSTKQRCWASVIRYKSLLESRNTWLKKVNPGGWKAIWRSTPTSNGINQAFDVFVEVNNIDVNKMTAEITICEPVVCQSLCTGSHPQLKIEVVNQNLRNKSNCVPIVELFPVYDESGENDETALAIEHVRFFYNHVWREWDEDDDSDCSYTSRYLETRLRLYYDIQDGTLPKELIKRYRETYKQYKVKLAELENLRKQMSASDSEQELDDLDVLKCAQKTEECNTLVHSLQMMENPQMRYLLATVSPAAKAALRKPRGPRPEGESPVTFIVAPKMVAGMVKSLSDDTVIEHCKHLSEALEVYNEGDFIHVHPGTYGLDGTVNLTDPVHITGIGDSNRILVSCEDDEDFSIDCYASGIHFKNITFEQESEGGPQGMLVIKQGDTTLEDCQLKCRITGISVKNEGNLVMKNCKVYDAKSAGVIAQPQSTIRIEKCDFYNCGEDNKHSEEGFNSSAAVQLQQDSSVKPKATVIDNTIHNNSGYGVCVVRSVSDPDDNPECSVNLDVTANKFRGNEIGDVGHIYLDTSI